MANKAPHYTREKLLGEGGMGKVYLAQDNQLQRQVAIKELTYQPSGENDSHSADGVNHALQEARLLARVNHNNIIQIYNVHDEGDHISLVMEYFKSKTLTQYLHETHSTLVQKLDLLQQLSAGLASAHKNEVIHCDLKPTNLLVNEQGHLKITDFGIALIADKELASSPLGGGEGDSLAIENKGDTLESEKPMLYGSLLYMSPEQIKRQQLDYRSDIFSLGIVAYQLIVGSHPFGRGSATEIARRICEKPPEHAKNLMLNAPSALTDLLMEMLIQPLEQRTLTASAIENRLKHIRMALLQAEISEQETMPLTDIAEPSNVNERSFDENRFDQNKLDPNNFDENTQQLSYGDTNQLTSSVSDNTLVSYNTEIFQSPFSEKTAQIDHVYRQQSNQANLPENKSTSLSVNSPLKKASAKNFTVTISFAVVCLLAFVWIMFDKPEEAIPRQVVILQPSVVANDDMAAMQQELVMSAVEDALRQAVINTKNMYLISQREVNAITKEYPDDLTKLQQAVGASDIISTELECNNTRCKVNFSRLVSSENKGEDSNNLNRFSVKSEKNWLVPIDKFNAIFSTSQAQFASLFPEQDEINQAGLVQRPIKEGDYREYIALYNEIKVHGNNSVEILTRLEALLLRSPYLYAGYSLFSRAAFDLYADSRNTEYLIGVEKVLDNSPPEYRYSAYEAIDRFGLALNIGDLELADLQLKEAYDRGANHFVLAELNAILLFFKGEYNRASLAFIESLNLRPSIDTLYNLAFSYWQVGDLVKSGSTSEKVLQIDPSNSRIKSLQASIWLLQGRLSLAIQMYEELEINSSDGKNLTNLSLAYALNNEFDKSHEFALKALKDNSKHPANILNFADIEQIMGNESSAKSNYQEIIQLLAGKEDAESLTYIALAYTHLMQPDLALASISKAQRLSPNSGEVFYASAIVYSILNENSSALHYVKSALKHNIGAVWFNLPWFDRLCENRDFINLMAINKNQDRCLN